jgi:hypothetical protein
MLYDNGAPINELEDAFGAKIQEIKDGEVIWKHGYIRCLKLIKRKDQ